MSIKGSKNDLATSQTFNKTSQTQAIITTLVTQLYSIWTNWIFSKISAEPDMSCMEIIEEAEMSSYSHEKYENMEDKTGQELGLMAEIRFDWLISAPPLRTVDHF